MKKIFSWCYAALAVLAAAAVLCVGAEQKQVAAMAAEEGVKLPIIMYHSVLDSEDKAGKYVVTPAEFEADVFLFFHEFTVHQNVDQREHFQ